MSPKSAKKNLLTVPYEYQGFVNQSCFYIHVDDRNAAEFTYVALGIAEEGGEVAGQMKKIVRDVGQFNRPGFQDLFSSGRGLKMLDECSDVLWYLTRMCTLYDITLAELAIYNTVKLYHRHYKPEGKPWPLGNLSYADALKLTQLIESRITDLSALTSMDTDTLSKPSVKDQ